MDITNVLNLLPLSPEQKAQVTGEIFSPENKLFAHKRFGGEPSEDQCVTTYVLGGGLAAFQARHHIPCGVQSYPRLNE